MDTLSPVPSVPADLPANPDALNRRVLLSAAGLAGAAVLGAFTSRAQAGPLDPPTGPIASTGKILTDVEPRTAINAVNTPPGGGYLFRILQSGSYYLTGNIILAAGQQGIFVSAAAVTIDLNGFAIIGVGAGFGIAVSVGTTIRNGKISNLGTGISIISGSTDVVVEDIAFDTFSFRGLYFSARSTARRCTFRGVSPVALECVNDYALVEDCFFSGATGVGAYLNSYSTLRNCRFTACDTGAHIGYGSRAERCSFDACTTRGLQGATRVFVDGCTATATSGASAAGIDVSDGATVTRSAVSANPTGILAGNACRITDCSFDANTTAVKITGSGSVVEACHFTRNTNGVDMFNVGGNYVTRCVMLGNSNPIAVNVGGNQYPTTLFNNANTATNPVASTIG